MMTSPHTANGMHMTILPPDFSPAEYLRLNPDVAATGTNAVRHYILFGADEGRRYKDAKSDKARLLKSGLFDPKFYLSAYPDIAAAGLDPAEHFLSSGAAEGRWASLFFRSDWYMECHPDFRLTHTNPLFHYLDKGSKLGYEPNPFFEPSYYVAKYKKSLFGLEPLTHFISQGVNGLNPSPRFDAQAYLQETGCKINPLKHYLETGMQAGIALRRAEPLKWGEAIDSAFMRVVKDSGETARTALLITHSPDGQIKPHVLHYAQQLASGGMSVFLIVAADYSMPSVPPELEQVCSHIVVRQNVGFDFAAWAHVMKVFPWLLESEQIILTNDSIIGPIGVPGSKLLGDVEACGADVVGLVENHEHADHLQSFFLAFNHKAITSTAFTLFWSSVINHTDKSRVIRDYEVTLTARLKAAGLETACLYQKAGKNNATIFSWEKLLDEGFPFLKFEVVKNADSDKLQVINSKLRDMSYDTSLIPQLNQ